MGSGISRVAPRSPTSSVQDMARSRFNFFRLLCGLSPDDDYPQAEEQIDDSSSTAVDGLPENSNNLLHFNIQRSTDDLSPLISCPNATEPDDRISDFPLRSTSIDEASSSSSAARRISSGIDASGSFRSLGNIDRALSSRIRNQQITGSVVHVDIVSLSSSAFSSRRNGRRLFWETLSRQSREREFSSSVLLSSEDTDDSASHDRWLLDLGIVSGESSNRDNIDQESQRAILCPSGLHRSGTCSCETFLITEGSGTTASISRIIMLAEALIEMLDQIHRQSSPFSFSAMSHPAPESVVNSFPLKSHVKSTVSENEDFPLCHICLDEYKEGDGIRVLPCLHEYHKSCVDKWLTEVHRVCPLCRGDVCCNVSPSS